MLVAHPLTKLGLKFNYKIYHSSYSLQIINHHNRTNLNQKKKIHSLNLRKQYYTAVCSLVHIFPLKDDHVILFEEFSDTQ